MNLRRGILLHLYDKGIYTDITEFIMQSVGEETDDIYSEIQNTINNLERDKLIKITSDSHKYQFGTMLGQEKLDFKLFREKGWKISAKIEPLGIEKVDDWDLKDQLKKVNQSILATNLISRTTAVVTVIIVLGTGWIGYLQYKKPNEVSVEQKQLDSLYKELRLLRELQQQQIGNSQSYPKYDTSKK